MLAVLLSWVCLIYEKSSHPSSAHTAPATLACPLDLGTPLAFPECWGVCVSTGEPHSGSHACLEPPSQFQHNWLVLFDYYLLLVYVLHDGEITCQRTRSTEKCHR